MSYFEPEKRTSDPSTVGWGTLQNGIQWFNMTTGLKKYWYNNTIYICGTVTPEEPPSGTYDFTSGWEDGDILDGGLWSGTVNAPVAQASVKHTGSYAMASYYSTNYIYKTFYGKSDCYLRAYVRFTVIPPNDGNEFVVAKLSKSDASTIYADIILGKYNGYVRWNIQYMDVSLQGSNYSTLATASSNTWYSVELNYKSGSGDGEVHFYVDGTELTDITHTGLTTGYTGIERLEIGNLWSAFTSTIYVDDVVLNSSYVGTVVA